MPMLLKDAQAQHLVELENLNCPKFVKWTGKADPDDKDSPKQTTLTPFMSTEKAVTCKFGDGPSDFVQITLDQFWKWADKPAPPPPEKEPAHNTGKTAAHASA